MSNLTHSMTRKEFLSGANDQPAGTVEVTCEDRESAWEFMRYCDAIALRAGYPDRDPEGAWSVKVAH